MEKRDVGARELGNEAERLREKDRQKCRPKDEKFPTRKTNS